MSVDDDGDPRLKQIAATQDAIMNALKNVKPIPQSATDTAFQVEHEKEQQHADAIGVSHEDYRKWASGAPIPHVTEAVKRFMSKR